ncbi:MAG: hypothetical protein ABI207_05600 [Crocinitomicaceae bacterium]
MNILEAIKLSKFISLIAYLLIILMGQMIGIPFFLWLIFMLFDFGNIDQLFAVLAITGLFINAINRNKKKSPSILLLDLLCFFLLLSPLIHRMIAVPIHLFNYLAFIIPISTFILFYLISLGLSFKIYLQNKKSILEN